METWIKALRSGKYQQAYKGLRKGDGFCCLGLACHVLRPEKLVHTGDDVWMIDDLAGRLPFWLHRELGINEKIENKLIAMNDDEGKTFAEIADYLETTN